MFRYTHPTFAFFLILSIISASCHFRSKVDLIDGFDHDIIIINIEDKDRAFIGDLLLKIDSCNPQLIAIDSWFIGRKNEAQDSVLERALQLINNDILGYGYDFDSQKLINSHNKFRKSADYEGHTILHTIKGFSSNFTPQMTINNRICTNIALRVLEVWIPGFKNPYKVDEVVPIQFTRSLDQIWHINGSELILEDHFEMLNTKVVLLGYIGPSDEDKHFTPIRQVIPYPENEPDTYGVVIMANQIRTLLDNRY